MNQAERPLAADDAWAVLSSVSRLSEIRDLLAAVDDAVERAEVTMEQLRVATQDAENRLNRAVETADRTLRVASELREDVSTLITALQNLAGDVESQVREHTANLMSAMATAGTSTRSNCHSARRTADGTTTAHIDSDIDDPEVAVRIAGDLEAKRDELRALIAEASELSRTARQRGNERRVPHRSHVSADAEEGLVSVDKKADEVQDEVEITQGSPRSGRGRYMQAIAMAASGVDPNEIAKRCGLGREEVRTLLRLQVK